MDLEYDRKFEEMKKYIPFLENMIKRLESTSLTSSNPRQAQLDKIKSLRDLLLDKKKRMKMENLLKCEQVLINLYAKVEQKDTFSDAKKTSEDISSKKLESSQDLDTVRNKLKCVVLKQEIVETLPEIARASVTEEVCTLGSKEPALFQRRPNKHSKSPTSSSPSRRSDKSQTPNSKRNYTRVLVSPEKSSKSWSSSKETSSEKPLFSRRSPRRRSPRRYSPSYHKRERKKSYKQESYSRKYKNITLNVPEDKLSSLNTKDIVSRIMNCNDDDVDVLTLQKLKSELKNELAEIGAIDNSDVILWEESQKKEISTKKDNKQKEEIEEGELSDSESEAIESVYGSLVIMDKQTNKDLIPNKGALTSENNVQSRKVQICVVIKSNKENSNDVENADQKIIDITDFEMYDKNKSTNTEIQLKDDSDEENTAKVDTNCIDNEPIKAISTQVEDKCIKQPEIINVDDIDEEEVNKKESSDKSNENKITNDCTKKELDISNDTQEGGNNLVNNEAYKANFYKPLTEQEDCHGKYIKDSPQKLDVEIIKNTKIQEDISIVKSNKEQEKKESTEIPLLNMESTDIPVKPQDKDLVSEIDILQALKNEILSDTIAIPGSEIITPPLHQPKITKVASGQATLPKKRISIEKYKEKSTSSPKTSLFINEPNTVFKDDVAKKQSRKLTEKECERFNFPANIELDSDDDDKDKSSISLADIYDDLDPKSPDFNNLAPKSPDHDTITTDVSTPPVIIPVDPVKLTIASSIADVDMRKMEPILSPNVKTVTPVNNIASASKSNDVLPDTSKNESKLERNKNTCDKPRVPLVDPRIRRDFKQSVTNSPNPFINPERTPMRSALGVNYPNMTPSMTPNSRPYETTPSHQSFEIDEHPNRKHVYAPVFPIFEPRDYRDQSVSVDGRMSRWDGIDDSNKERRRSRWGNHDDSRDLNYSRKWEDHNSRSTSVQRDDTSNYEKYQHRSRNERYNYDKRDDYSFNRSDCSPTPNHYFGRSECPATPSHQFGRLEAPMTPVHPFGRSECPPTPSHSFGRTDMPMTPSHPFGRSDYVQNQSVSGSKFVKSQDPRLNRSSEYHYNYDDDKEHSYYRDSSKFNRGSSYKSDQQNRSYNKTDSHWIYSKESSIGGNDRNKQFCNEQSGRNFNREEMSRRESSVGHKSSNEGDRLYKSRNDDHQEGRSRQSFRRERSVGRTITSPRAGISKYYHADKDIDNTLSVKPHAGRSFTIDTSVNRTFQEIKGYDKNRIDNFNARKQRAASVGRSINRESSVCRSLSQVRKFHDDNSDHRNRMNNNFRRACSMGRDIVGRKSGKPEKSFKEIKADFELYKSKADKKHNNIKRNEIKDDKHQTVKPSGYCSPEIRKKNETIEKQQDRKYDQHKNFKQKYSPKRNQRDPRMQRDQENDKRKYKDKNRENSRDRYNYGIVYSNDNIAKGTILGSGYGVKNYKIPKIKRPIEEKEKETTDKIVETIVKDKKPDVSNTEVNMKDEDVTKFSNFKKQNENNPDIVKKKSDNKKFKKFVDSGDKSDHKSNKVIDSNEKRKTRSSTKSDIDELILSDSENVARNRRNKKAVIHDSDSDDALEEKVVANVENSSKIDKSSTVKKVVSDADEKTENKHNDELDSNIGMEDLEIFSDNITLEPCIDNINALIAELDNDLDTSKNEEVRSEFTKEITLENMLENISSPHAENKKESNVTKTINESLEAIDNASVKQTASDINFSELPKASIEVNIQQESQTNKIQETSIVKPNETEPGAKHTGSQQLDNEKTEVDQNVLEKTKINEDKNNFLMNTVKFDYITNDEPNQSKVTSMSNDFFDKTDNETIDSTSNITVQQDVQLRKVEDRIVDGSSSPDSTINTEESVQDKSFQEEPLADSTNVVQSEINSDITSTYNAIESSSKNIVTPSSAINNSAPQIDSIVEPSSSHKETTTQIDSLGNILSILQDKSKIKQLLSMLGNQNSDEKIKKKLEKLSEIVSDDEEVRDENTNEEPTEKNDRAGPLKTLDTCLSLHEEQHQIDTESVDKTELIDITANNTMKNNDDASEELNSEELSKDIVASNEIKDTNTKSVEIKKPKPKKRGKKMPAKGLKNVKGKIPQTVTFTEEKRVTRSEASFVQKDKPKVLKPRSRELKQLQDDIKEMFLSDDILNTTGIRMCRLAKLVDNKNSTDIQKGDKQSAGAEKMNVLEKSKDASQNDDRSILDKSVKKKPKAKVLGTNEVAVENTETSKVIKYRPGPKSKTKVQKIDEKDPYAFESDSISETNTNKASENSLQDSSEYDSDSAESTKSNSSIPLLEIKKKTKRKRPGWQVGIIKTKRKKKKTAQNQSNTSNSSLEVCTPAPHKPVTIPDNNCFTDETYCFLKNVFIYSCRLCHYNGTEIVRHYKNNHPHSEIPLSRMSPEIAKEAIEQCEEINFQAISKMSTERYVCRFCFMEFSKRKAVLETFFWHVVSMHTGEYKQLCGECVNITKCPFNLDIPPPPKQGKGQLIGFICGKCNFTQISLENLKTHVIVRHNDEQTEVYTINLAVMSKKTISALSKRCKIVEEPRVLRSSRSNQSVAEISDHSNASDDSEHEKSDTETLRSRSIEQSETDAHEKIPRRKSSKSKITFETDDSFSEISNVTNAEDNSKKSVVKIESVEENKIDEVMNDAPDSDNFVESEDATRTAASDDILDHAHFKIYYTNSGTKEYVCCINGKDNHYKTSLLISIKKHTQTKHAEKWDGYCFVCKVIVTPQGEHSFKDCLQHYLDKHMDDFPVLENVATDEPVGKLLPIVPDVECERTSSPKTYINVRPLSELISKAVEKSLPKIESIVSLGASVETPQPSPSYQMPVLKESQLPKVYKYEEAQIKVMAKKHRVVLETMLSKNKLVQVFKCAGHYCSFTCDSAEDALLHASTHQRVGGENALCCTYCDFDSSGNAIDLVSHLFKEHGHCQYVCAHCFYRAAAGQLVSAHVERVHKLPHVLGSVLRTTVVTQIDDKANMLTRDIAVPYYVCCNHDILSAEVCKFRTYTPGKFVDHLQNRHPESSCKCYICSSSLPTAPELIEHMKSHGMKIYQCTWCVHGSDNEAEFLEHASTVHPSKQPQAYLRVITNKGGTNDLRVLPLVQLNKSKIPIEDIMPKVNNENPVREAERSIELEKLIGHTTMMIESMSKEVSDVAQIDLETDNAHTIDYDPSNEIPQAPIIPNVLQTPPRQATPSQDPNIISEQIIPVLKTETIEETAKVAQIDSNIIVCLDSDEEDSKQGIIDLSDEETPTPTKEPEAIHTNDTNKSDDNLQRDGAWKCLKCNTSMKSLNIFKRHITTCVTNNTEIIQCPMCPYKTSNIDIRQANTSQLFQHLSKEHFPNSVYTCNVCNYQNKLLIAVKKHMKKDHGINKYEIVNSTGMVGGKIEYFIDKPPVKRISTPKRKTSTGTSTAAPPTKKHYSPQEIDQLPINPILDDYVYCSLCGFTTKVRLNMFRHLQLHAEQQPVPQTAPVNPVPHLESNEKHFDKMVNLASSSIVNRAPDKTTRPENPAVALLIPPEAASRYPKYVPERQRHTCGAKGCSYISVDEAMLKCHWETLHAGTNDYHCVHCPPYQHLDTSKPLTASRIIAHLKMHDVRLYACGSCTYYHYKQQVVEKHMADIHKGGQVLVVREEVSAPPAVPTNQQSAPAPTMDLKPWQCGLCKFKSMLRQEVAEHCAKTHQSKMQFKCAYCPFRTSTLENVTKHQSTSHVGKSTDICYFYYKEGSIPDEPDGTPRWVVQRQKCGIGEPEVKTETDEVQSGPNVLGTSNPAPPVVPPVNLNMIKKEVDDAANFEVEETIEDLCKRFGQFCDPNGLKYKCSLCKVVMEDTKEAMQSHLYEELQYRKWGCSICYYKAFHKQGLHDHMFNEHKQNQEPIQLPVDAKVETWVAKMLQHQTEVIEKNRQNLSKQKIQTPKATTPQPSTSKIQDKTPKNSGDSAKYTMLQLEQTFGNLGVPSNMQFCCPKCDFKSREENVMQDHLESELTRIRWCCSNCTDIFQTYHAAQFHCKSVHTGHTARPVEAVRDPAMRSAWVAAVIRVQKLSMNYMPVQVEKLPKPTLDNETSETPDTPENSLLVVRYEEKVPTPETQLASRKRPAPASPDSDDERLIIDEPPGTVQVSKKKTTTVLGQCPYCDFIAKYRSVLNGHMLRHYNLKPYKCKYCDFMGYAKSLRSHHDTYHFGYSFSLERTEIPDEPPPQVSPQLTKKPAILDEDALICMICERPFTEEDAKTHVHDKIQTEFAKKGDILVKCCICLTLVKNVSAMQDHNRIFHSDEAVNYAFYKLLYDTRVIYYCGHCNKRFPYINDLKSHHNAVHNSLLLKYNTKPYTPESFDAVDDTGLGTKRKNDDDTVLPSVKRIAKKSTTKLPNVKTCARKSTTKLPIDIDDSDSDIEEEYSYYGTKPIPLKDLSHITTFVSFCNTKIPYTLQQLSKSANINPVVVIKDINK